MNEDITAIVTGAFGFAGANLVEELAGHGHRVIAVGRKDSSHNERLKDLNITRVFLNMDEYDRLLEFIPGDIKGDVWFFHLAWGGDRNEKTAQENNVKGAIQALKAAIAINDILKKKNAGKVRFIATGSQAENAPCTEYGRCKQEAHIALEKEAKAGNVDFIWARLFSLIGKYEPKGRMLPDLIRSLEENRPFFLSSCEQNWDYLDAADAAAALCLLARKGENGATYDIAKGDIRPLKEYVEEVADILGADRKLIHFGERANPFVSLNPSLDKLRKDTGWSARVTFRDSVLKYKISP